MESRYISASDIERYSYCPLSWWLNREYGTKESEELLGGKVKHKKLARVMCIVQKIRTKTVTMQRMLLLILVDAILALFAALCVIFVKHSEVYGSLWGVGSIVLAISGIVLTYKIYLMDKRERKIIVDQDIPKGEIIYVDHGISKKLRSEKYGLAGRPDYMIKIKKDIIPVEVKTGRVPRGPLYSHIMQLASYCLLIKDNYRNPPPYGLLVYGKNQYQIDFTEELEASVIDKIAQIRKRIETREVHRNHRQRSKCVHCSRREICPERLE